jgi:phage shock protein PspC (stress-responsive transcriptional regulator)
MNTEMTDRTSEQQPPPNSGSATPPPPPGWRNARVSRMPKGGPEGGKVGGVVAGISRAYGFDLKTTRIATVVAMVVLPVTWFVYFAAWILLPPTPAQAVPLDHVLRDRRRMPLLLVIGLVLVVGGVGSLGSWFLFRGAPWGIVLIGAGVLLWMLSDRRHTPVPPPSAFPPPTAGTDGTNAAGPSARPAARRGRLAPRPPEPRPPEPRPPQPPPPSTPLRHGGADPSAASAWASRHCGSWWPAPFPHWVGGTRPSCGCW